MKEFPVNETYLMEGWHGWLYLSLALISFTAYHFIPRRVTELERDSIYKLFGTLGPGPVLIFLIRFFGTDHLILVTLIVMIHHGLIPPYTFLTYVLLLTEFMVAFLTVTVSYVIYKTRKHEIARINEQ